MENIKKNRIFYLFILPAFILSFCVLAGCSKSANTTLGLISDNMDKVAETIAEIEILSNSDLIIKDFMDEKTLEEIPQDNEPALYNTAMTTYITKLTLLNNAIYNTVQINNRLNNVKKQVIAKSHQMKSLCQQCLSEKKCVSKENLNSLEELNNSIMGNNTRAGLTRNEVKANLASVKEIQNLYSQKPEVLSSRYSKLGSSLNTRLSYYSNIYSGLESMENIILANCDLENYELNDKTNKSIDEQPELSNHEEIKTNYNGIKKNIDTYENAGLKLWGNNRVYNPIYSPDNYLNNSMVRNYGPYPYGYGPRYGDMYGYGMAMPYGYGGFTFPNINTFGTYKNIDTYRPQKPIERPHTNYKNEQTTTDENLINNSDNSITTTSASVYENDSISPKFKVEIFCGELTPEGRIKIFKRDSFEFNINDLINKPKTLEEPIIENDDLKIESQTYDENIEVEDGNNKLLDVEKNYNIEKLVNKKEIASENEFAPPKIPEEWRRRYYKAIPFKEMQRFIIKCNDDDGEDKFVNAPYHKPKIEKLENR